MPVSKKRLRIAIVANEPSADILGAGLIRALRAASATEIEFTGIGGPLMEAEGFPSLYPQERLAVMGLVEVLKHLPELLRIRRDLVRRFLQTPPDLLIGIDAPDFNLGLERRLRRAGIPTFHYVCPTVWAWRQGRVKNVRAAAEQVLCIFPFEPEFLARHGVTGRFVGHPLADEIPLQVDPAAARAALGLPAEGTLLALLPGSRHSELRFLADDFLRAALLVRQQHPDLHCVVPLVTPALRQRFEQRRQEIAPQLPITLIDGRSREVLAAADLALTASGTATLEALLLKRPQVVAYRVHPLTYRIVAGLKLVKVPFFSMANLLAGEAIAPEFIQHAITPEALASALMEILQQPQRRAHYLEVAQRVHRDMRRDASAEAATAILRRLEGG
jgi:lipid-A-disaccharide synthase